jgi:hypothetical protein
MLNTSLCILNLTEFFGEWKSTNELWLFQTLSLLNLAAASAQKLCVLPIECISVFGMILTVNSDCFPKQD